MHIELKPATGADVEAYVRIARRVESPINMATTDPIEVLEEFKHVYPFIILYEGRSVGYISYERVRSQYAHVSEFAVDPDFQGRGIGNQALRMLLDDLRSKGFNVFSLLTHPDNPAKRLYERHGFKVIGRIENCGGSGTLRLKLQCKD
jgi:ribosomal protein S18 acetylase RimI-like enzyme